MDATTEDAINAWVRLCKKASSDIDMIKEVRTVSISNRGDFHFPVRLGLKMDGLNLATLDRSLLYVAGMGMHSIDPSQHRRCEEAFSVAEDRIIEEARKRAAMVVLQLLAE